MQSQVLRPMHGPSGWELPRAIWLQECGALWSLESHLDRSWNLSAAWQFIPVTMGKDARVSFPHPIMGLYAPGVPWDSPRLVCKRHLGYKMYMVYSGENIYHIPVEMVSNTNQCFRKMITTPSGIHVLVDHGRFAPETVGCEDFDEILSHVQASMRDKCAKHGFLSWNIKADIYIYIYM